MHEAVIDISFMLSAAEPAQFDPEVILKPPSGPQELIVVGGTAGCGATSRQPLSNTSAPIARNVLYTAYFSHLSDSKNHSTRQQIANLVGHRRVALVRFTEGRIFALGV